MQELLRHSDDFHVKKLNTLRTYVLIYLIGRHFTSDLTGTRTNTIQFNTLQACEL